MLTQKSAIGRLKFKPLRSRARKLYTSLEGDRLTEENEAMIAASKEEAFVKELTQATRTLRIRVPLSGDRYVDYYFERLLFIRPTRTCRSIEAFVNLSRGFGVFG